ncbi:hypothetical protein [Chryseobacterium sp. c4a]|uniref:hypothetical protein n=1 Tax=Chryseobacterium sp. c4a TaxID=1573582 RepID=UPI001356B7AC|nr:hypothetical protein [Chryseobacterium sp. c4a]
MKTKLFQNMRKLDRRQLRNVDGGIIIDRMCCTMTEEGDCCEWARDLKSCKFIYC